MSREDAAFWDTLTDLSDELGDDTPAASVSRARALMQAQAVPLPRFLAVMQEARALTLRYAPNVYRMSTRQPGRKNLMPYWFTTLASLLTAPAAHPPGPGRPPGRRRRRSRGTEPTAAELSAKHAASTYRPAPPSSPPCDTWGQVCEELRPLVTMDNYARWFVPARQVATLGDVLTVAVPDAFHQTWMQTKLSRQVEQAAARVQPGLQVVFEVLV